MHSTQVLLFGSAPLKTYLPDGDIDLTVLSHQYLEEDLARNLCTILKCEENSEFQVKDVQCIHAQVCFSYYVILSSNYTIWGISLLSYLIFLFFFPTCREIVFIVLVL